MESDYKYTADFVITEEMKEKYDENGYMFLRGLLDADELEQIRKVVRGSDCLTKHAYTVTDGDGKVTRRAIWRHPGNDVTGMVGRCEKVVGTCEKLLGGEVYHYHTKLMMKDALVGGKHIWHQDYGYWYNYGILTPDMMTVFISLDPCKKENGCLQMLPGSHRCGRIDHVSNGQQIGADMTRVNELKNKFPLIYAELDPGDAIFFHSNIVHTSSDNVSPTPRWAFLCCYNKADNNPTMDHHFPKYTPLEKVNNDAVRTCTNYSDMSGKYFLDPEKYDTISGKKERDE